LTNIQLVSPNVKPKVPRPRKDTKGKYISPYRADGTLASWAEKAIASAALGNGAGEELGKMASSEMAGKVPGGAVLGSLFGKKPRRPLLKRRQCRP